jgi:hypothetical protein
MLRETSRNTVDEHNIQVVLNWPAMLQEGE